MKKTIEDFMNMKDVKFQFFPRSAKVLDKSGKLLGIVTDVIRFDSLMRANPRKLFDGVSIVRKKGLPTGADMVKNYFFNGKEVYAISDGKVMNLEDYKQYLENKLYSSGTE